ncbi:unnamed protein product, partial [Symbiodinium microadriaticum]
VRIRGAIAELLPSVDLQQVSVYDFRCQIARHLGFGRKGLEASADQVNVWIREAVDNRVARAQESPEQRMEAILEMLGSEDDSKKTQVHFITFSRLLPGTVELRDLRDLESMSREDIACCVWKAFDEPLAAGRGRPPTATELVRKIAVFREEHADGMHHFHVAVLLRQSRSFVAAKRTLRERDHLAAHFSASHTGFWSAVRYGHIPTAKKPEVDATPLSWSEDGGWGALDLFAESQRPWMAHVWKRRHEASTHNAPVLDLAVTWAFFEESAKQASSGSQHGSKRQKFNKLDLTSIILAKNLTTKAAVLAYAQDHGTAEMQVFVHAQQRKLPEFLQEAAEWGMARAAAVAEKDLDWDLVCPTNSGKTTILLPFDDLFGFKHVFHKPALNSKFALRNLLKEKRFLFWDDYRPVEYAQETLPVTAFLSLFQGQPLEVQVSQAFNDGNVDFEWHRGCVMTAKSEGLWVPHGSVSQEDVRHMQSRVHVFTATATIRQLQDTVPCKHCMCAWIRDAAAQHDAAELVRVLPLPGAVEPAVQAARVDGLAALCVQARLPTEKMQRIDAELRSLGALHAAELAVEDWRQLQSWGELLPFEQRRLLAAVSS